MEWLRAHWPVLRGLVAAVAGLVAVVVGLWLGREVAVVAGLFLLVIALYFSELESITAFGFSAKARQQLVADLAEAARAKPGERGLSDERIDTELTLRRDPPAPDRPQVGRR